MRENVDTDAIIPSREMKSVSKEGLADGLFAGWRYMSAENRMPKLDFILNVPPFDQASILVSGKNFGCGSSREHAVWALREWGIKAIIAPSFGSIFRGNCIRNGVLPVVLDPQVTETIAQLVLENLTGHLIKVDLENKLVNLVEYSWPFEIDDTERQLLLEGLDQIDVTLREEAAIRNFEEQDQKARRWAYI
jgi:3-isopropylmalate/(R)-2-methylmalate dehydratase small subunit